MPTLTSSPADGRPSRRAVLAGALVLAGGALTACTADRPSGDADRRSSPRPEVDPDVALAATALADVRRTLDLLEATTARHGGLRDVLSSARAVHGEHADFLAGASPSGGSPSTSPSAAPSPTPSSRGRRAVPRNRGRALAEVARAEETLTATLKTHALTARSGAFARVLGSMGAAAAQQAAALPTGGLDGAGGSR